MNKRKRGMVLLLGIMVVVVLTILSAMFFSRSITENNSVKLYTTSTKAFWNAEEGLSQAIAGLPSEDEFATPNNSYNYSVTQVASDATSITYQIGSTGREIVGTGTVNRTIESYVQFFPFQGAGDFTNAIEVNNELKVGGSVTINGGAQGNANVAFTDKFKCSPSDVKALAKSQNNYYEDPDVIDPDAQALPAGSLPDFVGPDVDPADGVSDGQVTWIKVTDANRGIQIPKNDWNGKGILIIEGNADIEGSKAPDGMDGIIWVTGTLKVAGDANIEGTIISETTADLTSATGNAVITWDIAKINGALRLLDPLAKRARLSWREVPD